MSTPDSAAREFTYDDLPPDLKDAFKYYRGRKRAMAVEIANAILPILKPARDSGMFACLDSFAGFSSSIASACINHVRLNKQND